MPLGLNSCVRCPVFAQLNFECGLGKTQAACCCSTRCRYILIHAATARAGSLGEVEIENAKERT